MGLENAVLGFFVSFVGPRTIFEDGKSEDDRFRIPLTVDENLFENRFVIFHLEPPKARRLPLGSLLIVDVFQESIVDEQDISSNKDRNSSASFLD